MRRGLLTGLLLLAACGVPPALDAIRARGALIVATEPEFPPFEYKDARGEFQGFDMDLSRELAKDLGVELRVEEMEFTSLIPALKTGKADLIASGMTATEERAKSVRFTDPYFHTGLCLLVHAKSGIERAEDVDGKRVVAKLGTTGQIAAERMFPKSRPIRTYDTENACAQEVSLGRADAFLYDQLSILNHHKKNPGTTRAILTPLTHEPYSFAVRLGDEEFRDRLNAFLKTVREDGRYAALRKKHLGELPDEPR
ncbi:MAG: transporter substrate-binding domain-containing protein [Planctomycetota bacterium]